MLVELVARGSRVYTAADIQHVLAAIDDSLAVERSLRLELVFELLSREIDLATLVEVFSLLKQAVPNAFHYALVLSEAATIFATNQDVLLEQAADDLRHPHETVHLHGRCDQPSSIITTIGQYAAGLPSPTVDNLNDVLGGHRLVVLGYSGRDRDIMPVLATAPASEILWIQYAPARHTASLSPELQALSSFLGSRLTIVREPDPYGWLSRQIGRSRTRLAEAAVRGPSSAPMPYPLVRAKFDSIEERKRELALCRLLRHNGAKEIALKGLRRLRPRKAGDHPDVSLAIAAS